MSPSPPPTEVLRVTADAPEAEVIARAAERLRQGGLVAFPTETVYGLGANALDPDAVARIFAAKGRPSHNPLIVHVPDVPTAQTLASEWPDTAAKLAQRFWPGPLTLVLPRKEIVPGIVTAGGATVAIRIPAHPVALALLRAVQLPVAAPSANRSTQLSPTTAQHVLNGLEGRIEMILDGGPTTGGLESTVLDLTATPPRLLRPGLISPAAIEAVIGHIAREDHEKSSGTTGDTGKHGEKQGNHRGHRGSQREAEGEKSNHGEHGETRRGPEPEDLNTRTPEYPTPFLSPGMMERHYAPLAPLELVSNSAERVRELEGQGERVGWLTFVPHIQEMPNMTVVMPMEVEEYAAQLYAVLHALDDAEVTRIVVERPPEGEAWLAIHDRLRRATHS